MKENTYTYTVRSQEDPEKSATFTLHNGSVSVQLSTTMLEQVENVAASLKSDEDTNVTYWAKPLATGLVQKILRPFPVNDFDADLADESLQTTAWLRTGGLRLAPITMTWHDVDNPDAAQAFVQELDNRKQSAPSIRSYPSLLDYWASWIIAGASLIVFTAAMVRLLQKVRAGNTEDYTD